MEVLNIDFFFFSLCSISERFIIFFWDISQRQEIALITCSKVTYTDYVFKNLVKKCAVPGHKSINQQERQESFLNKQMTPATHKMQEPIFFPKPQRPLSLVFECIIFWTQFFLFKNLWIKILWKCILKPGKGRIKHKFLVGTSFPDRDLDFDITNFINFLSLTLYHNTILKKHLTQQKTEELRPLHYLQSKHESKRAKSFQRIPISLLPQWIHACACVKEKQIGCN